MTDSAFSDVLTVARRGDVALIELHRPEARNAVNLPLATAICESVLACQDAGAIVLTGADPAFCAGLDLRSLGVESLGELPPFVATVAGSSVPVIAAVNGPAVTGGFELALAADFIVASERAAFADTHLRVGVYPGPVLVDLPRRAGPAWAREMSLTGNFVDAETALRIGIANHVVPHEELVPFAVGFGRGHRRTGSGHGFHHAPRLGRHQRHDHRAGPEDSLGARPRGRVPPRELGSRDRGSSRGGAGPISDPARLNLNTCRLP